MGTTKDDTVLTLQQQLHDKDMKLTEMRLESLSSAHQLEQLRETMNRMKVHVGEAGRVGKVGRLCAAKISQRPNYSPPGISIVRKDAGFAAEG